MIERTGLLLGIDVGGSKISGLAIRADGAGDAGDAVVADRREPMNGLPLDEQVVAVARALVADAGMTPPDAIGIAVPGQVNADTGVMRLAVNVDAGEVAIGPLVEAAIGAPCFVEHDARAAALWLASRGDGNGLAYLSVGTGISAAVIIDGRLVRGVSGLAGEIGHAQAVEDGPPCPCGLTGCLETVAAGPAVARMVAEAIARGEATTLSDGDGPEQVYRAAAAGDDLAGVIADRVGVHLARAIRALVLGYGTDRVVIGGGLSRAGRPFLQPILAELERERHASPLVRQAFTPNPVELLDPSDEAGALGAVVVARSGLNGRREVGNG
jgi:glucokinase